MCWKHILSCWGSRINIIKQTNSLTKEQIYLHDRIRRFNAKYNDKPQSTRIHILPDFAIDHKTSAEVLRIWLNTATTNEKIYRSQKKNTLHNYFQPIKKRKIYHPVETLSPSESMDDSIPYLLPAIPIFKHVTMAPNNHQTKQSDTLPKTRTNILNTNSPTCNPKPQNISPIIDTPTRILNAFPEYAPASRAKRKLF